MPFKVAHILTVFFFLITAVGLSAQCPQTIRLESQFEVDNFENEHPTCFEFNGNLIVKGTDITNLDGLSFLTSMTGVLEIIETSINSIESLSAISTFNGTLLISENVNLENLNGLQHVINLDSLVLHANPAMKDFIGLNNLQQVKYMSINGMNISDFSGFESLENAEIVMINDNDLITSLEGLGKVKNMDVFELNLNSNLENLNGLDEFDPTNTKIKITGSPKLKSMQGFEHLEELYVLELRNNNGLESLDGLENVENIESLNISQCATLVDLSGLQNVEQIGADLTFLRCGSLNDFSQLTSLEKIGNNLFLSEMVSLVNLDDFNNVSIGHEISIANNPNLVNITGFENLVEIDGDLNLDSNKELISIEGFIDMTANGGLIISQLQKLKDLTGLANLQFVNGKLEIFENVQLENLDDLVSLSFIAGIADAGPEAEVDLQIDGNMALTSLSGLNDLLYADDKIFIKDNPLLTICDVESICRFINDPNIEITIENNGFPCNSPDEIRSDCNSVISDTPYDSCEAVSSIEINEENANNNGLIDVFDNEGKVICAINANGNDLGKTDFHLFVSSTDRYDDFNRPILRRNLSIVSEFEPTSSVAVRLYFKDIELKRLQSLDPDILVLSDLRITPLDSICSGSFSGNQAMMVESSSQGNYLSEIDYYIEASFDEFSNFFIHGPNQLGIDQDGDGYDSLVDCNDSDASINTGAIEIPDNDIDENCDGELGITDVDGDGYGINEDCDDNNPAINPGAEEILDNDVDEDCDGIPNITDADGDGFIGEDDCDDNDPAINIEAIEILDNDIDENCDGIIEITDLDNDGFGISEDCDDFNAAINPDQTEVPYNGIDEDCDPLTLDDDLDQDGFLMADDCDDDNPNINPGAEEIPDNDIDENCDGILGITDEDNDGFGINEDCDDTNPEINPEATEIPGNTVDENCDGIFTPVIDLDGFKIEIFPNPVSDFFVVSTNAKEEMIVQLIDLQGRILIDDKFESDKEIQVANIAEGSYFLKISNQTSTKSTLLFIAR